MSNSGTRRDRGAEIPASLTPRQRVLAVKRLANPLTPESRLMVEAGYAPNTAKSAKDNLPPGGSHALALRVAKENPLTPGARALLIQEKAAAQVLKRIDSDDASDVFLLGALKTSSDIVAANGDTFETPRLSRPTVEWCALMRRRDERAWRLGARAALRAVENGTAEEFRERIENHRLPGWLDAEVREAIRREERRRRRLGGAIDAEVLEVVEVPVASPQAEETTRRPFRAGDQTEEW